MHQPLPGEMGAEGLPEDVTAGRAESRAAAESFLGLLETEQQSISEKSSLGSPANTEASARALTSQATQPRNPVYVGHAVRVPLCLAYCTKPLGPQVRPSAPSFRRLGKTPPMKTQFHVVTDPGRVTRVASTSRLLGIMPPYTCVPASCPFG